METSRFSVTTPGLPKFFIWPVKIVPEMTYYVSSGTLNPTHSLTLCELAAPKKLLKMLMNFAL